MMLDVAAAYLNGCAATVRHDPKLQELGESFHTITIEWDDLTIHLTRSEAEKLAGELNSILPEPGTTPA